MTARRRYRHTGHRRAQRLYTELGVCEVCGEVPATERHHKDDDPQNNARENVVFCCRACHGRMDGRDAALGARGPELGKARATPAVPCAECGRLAKPTRRGLCHACYERHRREGAYGPA